MTEVKINPFSEIIAKKLSGIGDVPVIAQQRMIGNAINAATKYHEQRIADLEAQLAESQRREELLRAVAEAAQWNGTFDGEKMWCPICDSYMDSNRHFPTCPYYAAIDGGAMDP